MDFVWALDLGLLKFALGVASLLTSEKVLVIFVISDGSASLFGGSFRMFQSIGLRLPRRVVLRLNHLSAPSDDPVDDWLSATDLFRFDRVDLFWALVAGVGTSYDDIYTWLASCWECERDMCVPHDGGVNLLSGVFRRLNEQMREPLLGHFEHWVILQMDGECVHVQDLTGIFIVEVRLHLLGEI